jgi:hypothetical protein
MDIPCLFPKLCGGLLENTSRLKDRIKIFFTIFNSRYMLNVNKLTLAGISVVTLLTKCPKHFEDMHVSSLDPFASFCH